VLVGVLVVVVDLAANPRRDSDDHRRNGDASDEGYADRRADDCSQLPQQFLLSRPKKVFVSQLWS